MRRKQNWLPLIKGQAVLGVEPGTFDFLGFTFYLGKSRAGRSIPKLRTKAKSMRAKLKKVTEWVKQIKHSKSMQTIWSIFQAKIQGHIQYYGVSFNIEAVEDFIYEATKIMFKWLNRRSQRRSFSWEKFRLYIETKPLPVAKVVHRLF